MPSSFRQNCRRAVLGLMLAASASAVSRAENEPGSPEKGIPLQDLLARALKAAEAQDMSVLNDTEKALGPVNEAIFRVFGRDVQGGIRRAAGLKKQDVMVRVIIGQTLLSIRLLLRESRSIQDPRSAHARLQQSVLNYRVIEKPMAQVAPELTAKLTAAFQNLETAMAVDVSTAGPAADAIEQLLAVSADAAKPNPS